MEKIGTSLAHEGGITIGSVWLGIVEATGISCVAGRILA